MEHLVKKNRINFSRSSISYDKYAVFQKDVADILLKQLSMALYNKNIINRLVLDLGCGTGLVSYKLKDILVKNCSFRHSYDAKFS